MKKVLISLILCFVSIVAMAQRSVANFVAPLGIPLILSANFGELRPDHFHSGLDFKTRGSIGYKVYAADEGYVSRIAISPWGYGKAIYIDHPSGYTTVYAHLDAFVGAIADTVARVQYTCESYAIDTTFAPGVLPVTRGMYIALSGNSGSSGGPHLHFEVRHTATESPIDPLPWYKHLIEDNRAPEPRSIALYRHDAAYEGTPVPKSVSALEATETHLYKASTPFTAWGRVSLGIKAYDRMNETTNIYGVRKVRCWVDDLLIFSSTIDSITFAETRYINSLIDYHELRSNKGSTIMRTALLPGNKLSTIYDAMPADGTFVIDEERAYNCRYELVDGYGNTTQVSCVINGKSTQYKPQQPEGVFFDYLHDNEYATEDMNIHVPMGALYDNLYFEHSSVENAQYYSHIHKIHNRTVPLQKWCDVAIKLTCDTLPDNKYYVVNIANNKKSPVKGKYESGWYEFRVRTLGSYAVAVDTIAPVITPLDSQKWAEKGEVAFKITDKGSGIDTYRAEMNGNFCLFEYDAKRNKLSCELADTPFKKGEKYNLKLTVTDCCGNVEVIEHTIKW